MSKKKKKEDKIKIRRRKRTRSVLSGIFNSFIAVVSISALILFIIVLIGKMSEVDKSAFNNVSSKLFTNFNKNEVGGDGNLIVDPDVPIIYFDRDGNNELLFKICIMSDIHNDKENLAKSIIMIKETGCEKLFVLGDLTDYGDVESLKDIRSILDSSGIEYYAIPGDHDIADSLSAENFNKVFGIDYHIMEYEGVVFLLIDNSANFTEIGNIQMSWIEDNIGNADFVVMSQPLFTEGLNPPFSSTYMGSMPSAPESDDIREKQQYVKEQRDFLLDLIRKNDNVRATIAGDHHRSSDLSDPVRSELFHYVVGAVTSTVNDFPQTAIQSSRFSVLSFYKGGSYDLEDILLD